MSSSQSSAPKRKDATPRRGGSSNRGGQRGGRNHRKQRDNDLPRGKGGGGRQSRVFVGPLGAMCIAPTAGFMEYEPTQARNMVGCLVEYGVSDRDAASYVSLFLRKSGEGDQMKKAILALYPSVDTYRTWKPSSEDWSSKAEEMEDLLDRVNPFVVGVVPGTEMYALADVKRFCEHVLPLAAVAFEPRSFNNMPPREHNFLCTVYLDEIRRDAESPLTAVRAAANDAIGHPGRKPDLAGYNHLLFHVVAEGIVTAHYSYPRVEEERGILSNCGNSSLVVQKFSVVATKWGEFCATQKAARKKCRVPVPEEGEGAFDDEREERGSHRTGDSDDGGGSGDDSPVSEVSESENESEGGGSVRVPRHLALRFRADREPAVKSGWLRPLRAGFTQLVHVVNSHVLRHGTQWLNFLRSLALKPDILSCFVAHVRSWTNHNTEFIESLQSGNPPMTFVSVPARLSFLDGKTILAQLARLMKSEVVGLSALLVFSPHLASIPVNSISSLSPSEMFDAAGFVGRAKDIVPMNAGQYEKYSALFASMFSCVVVNGSDEKHELLAMMRRHLLDFISGIVGNCPTFGFFIGSQRAKCFQNLQGNLLQNITVGDLAQRARHEDGDGVCKCPIITPYGLKFDACICGNMEKLEHCDYAVFENCVTACGDIPSNFVRGPHAGQSFDTTDVSGLAAVIDKVSRKTAYILAPATFHTSGSGADCVVEAKVHQGRLAMSTLVHDVGFGDSGRHANLYLDSVWYATTASATRQPVNVGGRIAMLCTEMVPSRRLADWAEVHSALVLGEQVVIKAWLEEGETQSHVSRLWAPIAVVNSDFFEIRRAYAEGYGSRVVEVVENGMLASRVVANLPPTAQNMSAAQRALAIAAANVARNGASPEFLLRHAAKEDVLGSMVKNYHVDSGVIGVINSWLPFHALGVSPLKKLFWACVLLCAGLAVVSLAFATYVHYGIQHVSTNVSAAVVILVGVLLRKLHWMALVYCVVAGPSFGVCLSVAMTFLKQRIPVEAAISLPCVVAYAGFFMGAPISALVGTLCPLVAASVVVVRSFWQPITFTVVLSGTRMRLARVTADKPVGDMATALSQAKMVFGIEGDASVDAVGTSATCALVAFLSGKSGIFIGDWKHAATKATKEKLKFAAKWNSAFGAVFPILTWNSVSGSRDQASSEGYFVPFDRWNPNTVTSHVSPELFTAKYSNDKMLEPLLISEVVPASVAPRRDEQDASPFSGNVGEVSTLHSICLYDQAVAIDRSRVPKRVVEFFEPLIALCKESCVEKRPCSYQWGPLVGDDKCHVLGASFASCPCCAFVSLVTRVFVPKSHKAQHADFTEVFAHLACEYFEELGPVPESGILAGNLTPFMKANILRSAGKSCVVVEDIPRETMKEAFTMQVKKEVNLFFQGGEYSGRMPTPGDSWGREFVKDFKGIEIVKPRSIWSLRGMTNTLGRIILIPLEIAVSLAWGALPGSATSTMHSDAAREYSESKIIWMPASDSVGVGALFDRAERGGWKAMSIDVSKMDANHVIRVTLAIFKAMFKKVTGRSIEDVAPQLAQYLEELAARTLYQCNDRWTDTGRVRFSCSDQLPSGIFLTTFLNTILMLLLALVCLDTSDAFSGPSFWFVKVMRRCFKSMVAGGDDGLLFFLGDEAQFSRAVKKWFEFCGLEITCTVTDVYHATIYSSFFCRADVGGVSRWVLTPLLGRMLAKSSYVVNDCGEWDEAAAKQVLQQKAACLAVSCGHVPGVNDFLARMACGAEASLYQKKPFVHATKSALPCGDTVGDVCRFYDVSVREWERFCAELELCDRHTSRLPGLALKMLGVDLRV